MLKKFILFQLVLLLLSFTIFAVEKIEPEKMFNMEKLPVYVLYTSEKNWNKLLSNFDDDPHTGEYIELEKVIIYEMENGKAVSSEEIKGCKLGLKGNSWRIRPEGRKLSSSDFESTQHHDSMGIFNQSNFKLKFSKKKHGYDRVDLKFFVDDYNKCRNIFASYFTDKLLKAWNLDTLGKNKYTDNSYTVSPFGSYIHLYIAIEGDFSPDNEINALDLSMKAGSNFHAYDFGLYQLLEDSGSKGFLKTRFGDGKDGYYWKCGQNNQVQYIDDHKSNPWPGFNLCANFYIDKESSSKFPYSLNWFTAAYNSAKAASSRVGNIFGIKTKDYRPSYSYGGTEETFDEALDLLAGFIYNLNFLKVENEELKNWLFKGKVPDGWENSYSSKINQYKFDYKSFLAAYAIQQAIGSWDNYLHNSNNFSIYFNVANKTVYLLPFDLKLTLGVMCAPPQGTKPMGLHDLYDNSYIPKAIAVEGDPRPQETYQRHSLVTRLLKIKECENYYEEYLMLTADVLEDELEDNFEGSIGAWYKLMYNNFYQGELVNSNIPCPFDTEYKQVVSESTNALDYIYNKTAPSAKDYIQLPNNTTNTTSDEEESHGDFYKTVRDSTSVGWGVWFGPAQNLAIFSEKEKIWDGETSDSANFISTSCKNIREQIDN